MAKFYPTVIDNFHGSDGEVLVYEALKELNDEYTVFHSYRWLRDKRQRRSEGEVILSSSTLARVFYPSK